MIRGRFYNGAEFSVDELPTTVEDGPFPVTFTECEPGCDKQDSAYTTWDDRYSVGTIHAKLHLHASESTSD